MQIIVSAQGTTATKPMEVHAQKRARKLTKYHAPIHKIEYDLKHEKGRKNQADENSVKIRVYLTQKTLVVKHRDADMYAAIDAASQKMEREVRKEKEKLVSRTKHAIKNIFSQFKWKK